MTRQLTVGVVLCAGLCLFSAAAIFGESPDAAPGTVPENSELVEPLEQAFAEGFVVGPKRIQEAQKFLNQARKIAPHDPRVEYTHGLLLVKQSQLKQAVPHFQAAITENDSYWPAWQGAIWAQFADKRYDTGFKQLLDFTRTIQQVAGDGISEVQRDAARWVGQLLGALAHAEDARRNEKLLAERSEQIEQILGEELMLAVEEGREAINERELERAQAAGMARQAAEQHGRLRRDRKSNDIDKNLEGAAKAKADNDKSKEEWKEWIDEELKKSDKDLGRLEGDYRFLDQRVKALDQSITQLGQELTAMELVMSTMNPRTTSPAGMQNAQQQYLQRQNQMVTYQMEYNATVGRLTTIAQAGATAAEKRAQAISRYEQATGELLKQNASLDKWSDRLKNEKKKLAIHKPAKLPKHPAGDKAADKSADKKVPPASFKTIFPLDLQHEKDRVLASLHPPHAAPAEDEPGNP
ncbi:MAG: hypothetical protein JSS02_30320 [Planctomycetes bacterium]|nr:hypothetical protein [Planctomycetota bacterium]